MAKLQRSITAEEHAKLDEGLKGMYEQGKDAKWHLSVDDAEGLKSALEKEREEKRALKEQMDKFQGVDPEKYKELLDAKVKAQRQKDLDEKNFEKVLSEEKAAAEARYNETLKKMGDEMGLREKKIEGLTRNLSVALVDGAATRAILAAKGEPDLLLSKVKESVKLIDVNGTQRAVVVDDKGEPRLSPVAKSAEDYMGVDELVAEIKGNKKYAGAFEGTGASGGKGAGVTATVASYPNSNAAQKKQERDDVEAQIRSGSKTLAPRR